MKYSSTNAATKNSINKYNQKNLSILCGGLEDTLQKLFGNGNFAVNSLMEMF